MRSALRLANLRYKGGLANYLDVLVAQRNLFEAELALTGTHRLQLVSVVQLYKALGGGWSPLEMAQPQPRQAPGARGAAALAAQQLASTSKSVAEVAGEVGYESEPSFNRAFKREFGLPPARFRSQSRTTGGTAIPGRNTTRFHTR